MPFAIVLGEIFSPSPYNAGLLYLKPCPKWKCLVLKLSTMIDETFCVAKHFLVCTYCLILLDGVRFERLQTFDQIFKIFFPSNTFDAVWPLSINMFGATKQRLIVLGRQTLPFGLSFIDFMDHLAGAQK